MAQDPFAQFGGHADTPTPSPASVQGQDPFVAFGGHADAPASSTPPTSPAPSSVSRTTPPPSTGNAFADENDFALREAAKGVPTFGSLLGQAAHDIASGRFHDAWGALNTPGYIYSPWIKQSPAAPKKPGGAVSSAISAVNEPAFGAIHRAGAGPIEKSAEDWVSSQLNVGNAAFMGAASLVEKEGVGALVKLGMDPRKAAHYIHVGKAIGNLGFLLTQGYSLSKDLPALERDWQDFNQATDPKQKSASLDKFKEDATAATLSGLATIVAAHGAARDFAGAGATTKVGQAAKNPAYVDKVHNYQAINQKISGLANQVSRLAAKLTPEEREAVTNYREANGNVDVLKQREAEAAANPATAQHAAGYKNAQNLSPKAKKFDSLLDDLYTQYKNQLQARDLLPEDQKLSTVPNPAAPGEQPTPAESKYIPHDYQVLEQNPENGQTSAESSSGPTGFLKKRVFKTLHEAEQAGYTPTTKDSGTLTANYVEKAGHRIALHDLTEGLKNADATDGSPLTAAGGIVAGSQVVPDVPSNAMVPAADVAKLQKSGKLADLVKSGRIQITKNGDYQYNFQDYRDVGLRTSKWIGTDKDGNPLYAKVPLYVHPEVADHLQNVLDNSAPKGFIGKALKVSSGGKGLMLSFSPFHWDTIFNRGLESGMGKGLFKPAAIDWAHLTPEQEDGLRNGLVVSNTKPGFSLSPSEGRMAGEHSLASKLPLIGKANSFLETKLFGPSGYIAHLKFDMYGQLKQSLMKSYPKLDEVQAGRIAAAQINNKFGGLNYTLLGRSLDKQSALRLALLAPDFLESTGRSVADLVGPYGKPLLKRFVEFNIAQYLFARVVNHLVNGQFHPESGFSVLSKDGKKAYSLRSTMGDFLHFIRDPRGFGYNRVNPLAVRTPIEVISGVDQYGRKVSPEQKVTDTLKQVTPIPLQGLFGKQSSKTEPEQLGQSVGIGTVNNYTPAEELAFQRLSGKDESGPLSGQDLVNHQNKIKLENNLSAAYESKNPQNVRAAQKAIDAAVTGPKGFITKADAKMMLKEGNTTRLQRAAKHLPLPDVFDVYNLGSLQEKKSLQHIIKDRVIDWRKEVREGKQTEAQVAETRLRIKQYVDELRAEKQ